MVVSRMLTCKVDNQGRMMLPASWRKRFGVKPSTALSVTEDESGALIVETYDQGVRRAQQIVARYLQPGSPPMSEELMQDRRREAKRE